MSEPQQNAQRTGSRVNAVTFDKGSRVQYEDAIWTIDRVLDLKSVAATHEVEGHTRLLPIEDLRPAPATDRETTLQPRALEYISEEEWKVAQARYEAIEPLLQDPERSRQAVQARAAETGHDTATLYRWIKHYSAFADLTALIPRKGGWKKGKKRLEPGAEKVIADVIDEFYLKKRLSVEKTIIEVRSQCRGKSFPRPAASTIRARIARIPERDRLRRRGLPEKARAKFQPKPGVFPGADFPLAVVQIDHTEADVVIVDDEHRKPMGRPWITVAIDVHSRIITGYHLALDDPSETSVALCMAQAVLPKNKLLLMRGIEAEWPVWGLPGTIHADNAGEFRSGNFHKSCVDKGIRVEWRPVKRPEYGGHIERLIGTMMLDVHDVPGTTFSSVADKGERDPEKEAALTFAEFDSWVMKWICKVYHQRTHSEIHMSPLNKWKLEVLGTEEKPGTGLPPKPDEDILLHFLPRFDRTVQRTGVSIERLRYYDPALATWIGETNPEDPDEGRKFVFRRDPRDISKVWFRHPTLQQYLEIPVAGRNFEAVNVWEYREALRRLEAAGQKDASAEHVMDAVRELRADTEAAQARTKKARRKVQRRKEHARKRKESDATASRESTRPAAGQIEPVEDLYDERPPSFGIAG